ncbi:MAG: hypothetical protein H6661_08500 [Ardenticatenaceae bacterium]|nr:hypothetical protein [Ardenticatenaceae bacterium]
MIAVAEAAGEWYQEKKTYELAQRPYLNADDMANLSAAEHTQFFTTYLMNVLREFSDYLESTEAETGSLDLQADRVGYTEAVFYATPEEMDAWGAELNAALAKVAANGPGNGRVKRSFAFISHPLK